MVLNFKNRIQAWFQDPVFLTILIVAVALILILILKLISIKMKKGKNKRGFTIIKLLESIGKYLIIIISIFSIFSIWGVDVTAALAGVGILGLIIGLGAQDLIKDLLAGIGIVFDNQYEIDDIVEINGFKGKVTEIGLRTTQLINYKGEIRIIRNGNITEVSNFSRTFSLAVVVINVAYKENIDNVINLLDEKLPQMKEEYTQIIEGPIVAGVEALENSSVSIKITAKTNAEEHYAVERALLKKVKETFEENNIEIPFNQIVVHGVNKNE